MASRVISSKDRRGKSYLELKRGRDDEHGLEGGIGSWEDNGGSEARGLDERGSRMGEELRLSEN